MVDTPDDETEDVPKDINPLEDAPSPEQEQQTIREVMATHLEETRREHHRVERARLLQEQNKRVAVGRKKQEHTEREERLQKQKAVSESRTQARTEISKAARSLALASRAVMRVKLARFSPEGTEQMRVVKSLDGAMAELRRSLRLLSQSSVGSSSEEFSELDPEVEFAVETT